MAAQELSGKPLAQKIRDEVTAATAELAKKGVTPTLALVVATKDEAATSYIQLLHKTAKKLGIATKMIEPGPEATQAQLAQELTKLANDDTVHAIILQTPLPAHVDGDTLRALIPLQKDVDGANPLSAGRLFCGLETHAPATAAAVMRLLKEHKVSLAGQHAVVVGRSRVVGKPLAHLLLNQDATVTICHSKTKDLAAITKQADVLVAAAGQAKLITKEHVKPGATVIDVGTNMTDAGMVGDVDPAVAQVAGGLSPVPGGVGPVTTALLLQQTVQACCA